MNKNQFKTYLNQGLGRCILALNDKKQRERFKDCILKACLKSNCYDMQSEGTKTEYIFNAISFYEDKNYFIDPIICTFEKLNEKQSEDFTHLSELLTLFALDGYENCFNALVKKYQNLQHKLLKAKKTKSYDFSRDAFDRLCICFFKLDSENNLPNIIKDLGEIITKNKIYTADDFNFFNFELEESLGKKKAYNLLENFAKTCEFSNTYYNSLIQSQEEQPTPVVRNFENENLADAIIEEVKKSSRLSPALRIKFKKFASFNQKQRIANKAIKELKYEKKLAYLSAFEGTNEFIPCETLVEYANSLIIPLRDKALNMLSYYQNDLARNFARENLFSSEQKIALLKILITNLTEEDLNVINVLLNPETNLTFNREEYHELGMHILNVCEKKQIPEQLLLFVYQTTPCSVCRFKAVELLKNTESFEQIVHECVHDSYSETSSLAKAYLKID